MVTVKSIKEEIVGEHKIFLYSLTSDTDNTTTYFVAVYVLTDTFQYIPKILLPYNDLEAAEMMYNYTLGETENEI